ncbi:hypothetical protein YC2023_043027 [Brassica napus]
MKDGCERVKACGARVKSGEIRRSVRWIQNRVNKVGSLWSNCILSFGLVYLLQTNKSMNNRSYVDSGLDHSNWGEIDGPTNFSKDSKNHPREDMWLQTMVGKCISIYPMKLQPRCQLAIVKYVGDPPVMLPQRPARKVVYCGRDTCPSA